MGPLPAFVMVVGLHNGLCCCLLLSIHLVCGFGWCVVQQGGEWDCMMEHDALFVGVCRW